MKEIINLEIEPDCGNDIMIIVSYIMKGITNLVNKPDCGNGIILMVNLKK
jgi:hypothetical protein